MVKVRRCFWIDDRAFVLLQGKSVDPSAFINRVISLFVGLPEDPREALIKEQSEEIMIRLRISYEHEIRDWISKNAKNQELKDLSKTVESDRLARILKHGEILMSTSCFPQILKALDEMDYDNGYWPIALAEVNKANGSQLTESELWNLSLDWFKEIGKVEFNKEIQNG